MIKSITRQFDEDRTELEIGQHKIVFTARPIRAWNRCYWSAFRGYGPGFRLQCPWATITIR